MSIPLTDTRPEARRVHIELLRRASPAQRVEMARGLSDTVGRMSWQNLRSRYPADTEMDVSIRFVRLVYGADLAERVKRFLLSRKT